MRRVRRNRRFGFDPGIPAPAFLIRLSLAAILCTSWAAGPTIAGSDDQSTPGAVTSGSATPAAIPPELDRAARFLVDGDSGAAIREYEALLVRAPSDPMAPLACIATANLLIDARQDTTGALDWFDRVIRQYPDSPWTSVAVTRRAQQFAVRGDWSAAGEAWLTALRLQPSDGATRMRRAEIANNAADCLEKAGDPPRLAAACRTILHGGPAPEVAAAVLWRLGQVHETAGAVDSAAACYAGIIRSFPSSAEFTKAMGKRSLIEPLVPVDWALYELYARGFPLLSAFDYAAGAANADSLLAITNDPALVECGEYRKLTCETWVNGDVIAGVRGLRAFLTKYPDGLRAALARQSLEDRWQPLADMQQGALEAPDDVQSQLALGETFVRVRLYKTGLAALEKAVALAPDDPNSHDSYGEGLLAAGRAADSAREYERALALRPEFDNAAFMLGRAYQQIGDAAQAGRAYRRFLELQPDGERAAEARTALSDLEKETKQ